MTAVRAQASLRMVGCRVPNLRKLMVVLLLEHLIKRFVCEDEVL